MFDEFAWASLSHFQLIFAIVCMVVLAILILMPIAFLVFQKIRATFDPIKLVVPLGIVTPVVVLCLVCLGIMQGRALSIDSLTSTSTNGLITGYAEGEVFNANLKQLGGIFLILAGVVTTLCSLLGAWMRRGGTYPVVSVLIAASTGVTSVVFGAGLLLRESALSSTWHVMAHSFPEDRLSVLRLMLLEAPSLAVPLAVSMVIAAVCALAVSIIAASRKGKPGRLGSAALAAGIFVLLFGMIAFQSNWKASKDVNEFLRGLCYRGGAGAFFAQPQIRLPELENLAKLEPAPVIIIDPDNVHIEGTTVGAHKEIIQNEGFEIKELSSQLTILKKNYTSLHPNAAFPGQIIMQADIGAPGAVLSKVLVSCYRSGFTNARIATVWTDVIQTATFGELRMPRFAGVPFKIVDDDDEDALTVSPAESFGQFAERVDRAAGKGRVRVRLKRD